MARGKEEVHTGVDEQGNGREDSQDHILKTPSGRKGFIRPERCHPAWHAWAGPWVFQPLKSGLRRR
ncbi:hypothetical protein NtRootA9_29540 [Arthrobacter sp. NtRootA9]|nr:hypothetical protein NtRootA9_29540 [Arthrobacter sp. NtRootA9]